MRASVHLARRGSVGSVRHGLPPMPRLTMTSAGMIQRDGQNFRTGGINAFQLISNDYPTDIARTMTRPEIDSLMDKALAINVGVIRAHTLAASVGNPNTLVQGVSGTGASPTIVYDDTVWEAIEYAAYAARNRGIYLIPPFVDELGYYHGGRRHWVNFRYPGTVSLDYGVKAANSQVQRAAENVFYTDQQVNWDFEQYLRDWLNHTSRFTGIAFKDDPVFSIVQIGNELWTAAEDNPGWVAGKAAVIKSIAPQCLVMDAGTDGLVVENMAWNSPHVDILETHPYTLFSLEEVSRQAKFAAGVGKAYCVGEYPWTKDRAAGVEEIVLARGNTFTSMPWSLQNDEDLHNNGVAPGGDDYSLYVPGKNFYEQVGVARVKAHHQAMIDSAAAAVPPPIPQQGTDNFDLDVPGAPWDNDLWRVFEPTLEGGISFGNRARLVADNGTTRGRLHLRQAGNYDVNTYIAPSSRALRVVNQQVSFAFSAPTATKEMYLRIPLRSQYILDEIARRTCYFIQVGMETGGLAFVYPGKMIDFVETKFVAQAFPIPTYAPGVLSSIAFAVNGSSLSLAINGSQVWSGTDTSITNNGYTGFELRGGVADVDVDVDIDSWHLQSNQPLNP